MKLRNKLLPLFGVLGTTAVVAPIGLTSCSNWTRYTDMLNRLYKPGVTPYQETQIYNTQALTALYVNRAAKNVDIIRDDIFYTWSTILHDTNAKSQLDTNIKYTKFILDLNLSTEKETVFVEDQFEEIDVVVLKIDAHVAGKNINVDDIRLEKRIEDFDFHFQTEIHGVQNLTTSSFVTGAMPECFKDLFLINLKFENSFVELSIDGTYTFLGENEEHTLDHISEYTIPTAEEGGLSPYYTLFGCTVLAVGQLSVPKRNNAVIKDPSIRFASHYLKNVKLIEKS